MSIERIYEDVNSERITFGPHLIQRMWENGISIDQVIDMILTGIVNKKEKDERSRGKFTKFSISKGDIIVVLKDCNPRLLYRPTEGDYYAVPKWMYNLDEVKKGRKNLPS